MVIQHYPFCGNVPSTSRTAFRFFHEWAGCVVGEKAKGAIALARAEQHARTAGWTVEWQHDPDAWIDTSREWGWSEKDIERWEYEIWYCKASRYLHKHPRDHTCETAILRDKDGTILATLGRIWDACHNHRRVIAAELALEAI